MDLSASSATAPSEAEKLLRPYVGGERGGKLRSQLARLHRDTPMEKIEEAIQTACDLFVDKGEGISAPGQVYAWVRTTAHRLLTREEDQRIRELPVDPTHESLQEVAAEEPGPAEEAIAHEDEAELVALVREVSDSLPERKREILALYGAGYKRPEIASRLGLTERAVKRDLLEIMDEARIAIARKAGGGCLRGEPLVLRFAYGLASAAESEQARFHMKGCHRCEMLWEKLDAWREKVVVVLPAPAIEQASPGLLGRLAHRATDGVVSVKQQVLGGASQAKAAMSVPREALVTVGTFDPTTSEIVLTGDQSATAVAEWLDMPRLDPTELRRGLEHPLTVKRLAEPEINVALNSDLALVLIRRSGLRQEESEWVSPDGRRTSAIAEAALWALLRIAAGAG